MASARYKTAGSIINVAAIECGLSPVADPFASADGNFRLLVSLLNTSALELVKLGGWEHLRREATFTAAADDSGFYSLPPDYHGMVDQTAWNRSGVRPLGGPVSSQQAQFLKARSVSATLFYPFRQAGGMIEIIGPVPPPGTLVAMEYESTFWVQTDASAEPDADEATVSSDVVLFDPLLMARALKYHFKGERGFDVSKARDDYESSYNAARCAKPAPVLDLAGEGGGERFLSNANVPDTGYGVP